MAAENFISDAESHVFFLAHVLPVDRTNDFIAAGNRWLRKSRPAAKLSQNACSFKLLLETLECLIDGLVFFNSNDQHIFF